MASSTAKESIDIVQANYMKVNIYMISNMAKVGCVLRMEMSTWDAGSVMSSMGKEAILSINGIH